MKIIRILKRIIKIKKTVEKGITINNLRDTDNSALKQKVLIHGNAIKGKSDCKF